MEFLFYLFWLCELILKNKYDVISKDIVKYVVINIYEGKKRKEKLKLVVRMNLICILI